MSKLILNHDQEVFVNEASQRLSTPGWWTLCGNAGTGKEQPVTCIVKTPDGDKKLGDIKLGDEIYSVDGNLTKVVGVFPQGVKDVYEVEFRDGSKTRCGIEHLWNVRTAKQKCTTGNFTTKSLAQIIEDGVIKPDGDMRYEIPLCEPIQYREKNFYIHPYLLGALIGDGTYLGVTPILCNPDQEVYERCIELKPEDIKVTKCEASTVLRHSFTYPTSKMLNRMNEKFKKYGLNVTSPNRFIPEEYLLGSVDQRIELLRGLMDTDGSCRKNRTSFSTMSERLASDVKSLVQSLGGTAIVHTHDRGQKGVEFSINVKVFNFNPFHLSKKANNWKPSLKNPPSRYIKSIKKVGKEEQVCIKVDHPTSLYLTDEFIVTHNTTCLAELWRRYPNIIFLAPTHKAKGVLQKKLGEDAYVVTTTSFTKGFLGTKQERLESKISDAERKGDADLIERLKKEIHQLIKSGQAQEPVFGMKGRDGDDELQWVSVVCDESSMVDLETRNQIIENSDSAIFIGDDFQLPPVTRKGNQDEQDWFRRTAHDWRLSEIVRQAQDSGVLHLATLVREANDDFEFPIRKWMKENEDDWDDLFTLEEDLECYHQAAEDDTMMLSFMNDIVDEFSYDVRKALGRDPELVTPEDKLFAANNFGEEFKNKDEIQVVESMSLEHAVLTTTLNNLTTGLKSQVLINTARLKVKVKSSTRREMLSSKGLVLRYDYARTIHSSQGSEFRIVLYRHVGTDRLDTLTHNRLLYTAITRSSQIFVLLK